MIPILYNERETNFEHNGMGILNDTIDYEVFEERNGLLELELEYPSTGMWMSEITDLRIISAKPNDEDEPHRFRIYEISKDLETQTITIHAASITNDLGVNIIQDVEVTDVTAQGAMSALKAGLLDASPIDFLSDIETIKSAKWRNNNPLNCISGSEGSVIDLWGGEIKRNNDSIFVHNRRGKDRVTTIRQDKNIAGFEMTVSTKGMTTTISPYIIYRGETTESVIHGTVVNSPLVDNYPLRFIKAIDFSSEIITPDKVEGQTEEAHKALILEAINVKAQTYFTTMYPGCDKPKITTDIDLIQLSDSTEYERFKHLEHISLTDTVVVWVKKFNVDVEVKIVKLTYNGLSERVTKLTAGTLKSNIGGIS